MERHRVKAVCEVKKVEQAINPEKFSSWRKLIRVTARIQRLAKKISLRKHAQEGRNGPLTPEELERAEIFWIKAAQNDLNRRKEKGEFKSLSPFLDGKGVIRVGGRVDEAIVSYDAKHPALLPSNHSISWLKNLTHPVCIARPTRFIRHIQGPRYYKICIHRKKSSSIRYSTRLMSVILRPRFSSFIRL